jgi:hypothetical protein
MKELPRYRRHKDVSALKIKEVSVATDRETNSIGGIRVVFEDDSYPSLFFPHSIVYRHMPRPGDYYVRYDDGQEFFSPAKAFEGGYTPIKGS